MKNKQKNTQWNFLKWVPLQKLSTLITKKKKKHFLKLETIAYIQHPEIKLESKKECNEIYYPKQKEPRN